LWDRRSVWEDKANAKLDRILSPGQYQSTASQILTGGILEREKSSNNSDVRDLIGEVRIFRVKVEYSA
jgi:hypothetical protein